MFTRWGAFVYRRRRIVLVIAILLAAGIGSLAASTADRLSAGGWLDPDSESAQVAQRLETDFGRGRTAFVALIQSSDSGADASGAAFQQAIATAVAPVLRLDHVTGVTGYAETGDKRFISVHGDAAYVLIGLDQTDDDSVGTVAPVEAALATPPGYTIKLTGFGPIQRDAAALSEQDLQRAEAVSLPIAALVLILVFGSLLAAAMPLLVALVAIPSSIGVIGLLAERLQMSIFVLNIATMLGLALAIDYSLFITSRFREELARGRSVEQAVERAVGTAGKAVLFSGIAVAIGLSGLLWFKATALTSIGLGGAVVAISSVGFALTFLPAVLGMLGPRVNALSVRGLLRRLGVRGDAQAIHRSRWERVAHAVMRRPVAILVPVLAILFLVGSPFLRLIQGVPDASIYPAGVSSRDAWVTLVDDFTPGETTPITLLVSTNSDATSVAGVTAVMDYTAALGKVDGVTKVEGPFALTDPATGTALGAEAVARLFAAPAGTLPPVIEAGVASLRDTYIRGNTVRLDAISPFSPATPSGTAVATRVRAVLGAGGAAAFPGIQGVQVGGTAALADDFLASQSDRMPWAVGTTLLASAIILFLLFGSIAIPIKAVLMTLLSLSASFGALVWIFQEGNLHEALNFQPIGYTVAGNPIIMFAVLIGLSMDYEVLLLSRIQEAYRRTGDNAAAVAEGLGRTAGVITGAALIMVTVFSAFALADVVTIKSVGVGMAIAVALDATIIRVLLVPATMRLLGRWNWWAPGILGRVAERFGFSHVEDEDDLPEPVGASA